MSFIGDKMDWGILVVVAVLMNLTSSQVIRQPCAYPSQPTIVDNRVVQSLIDTIQLFIVSDLLEETLPEKQKIITVPSPTYIYDCDYYDDDCDVFPYDFVYDNDCPEFVTALVKRPAIQKPKKVCVSVELNDEYIYDNDCPGFISAMIPRAPKRCVSFGVNEECVPAMVTRAPKRCVNFGLNEELILPPLAPELPCGLGYLPGGLPVVAKAFAPSSRYCACGCGSTPCTAAALPICSPCSCAALAVPLNPEASGYVKPICL